MHCFTAARKFNCWPAAAKRLGIAGESAYRVPSLEIPNPKNQIPIDQLQTYAAVRLFIDRATAARSDFQVTNANAPAVAQICYRLDGIPLAIELAAARIKALRVEQIAARLDDRFRLLTGGSRTALPRQQTLRALIDWSYDLLSESEKVLLARLSVFAGGWSLDSAEEVTKDSEVLDRVPHLVEKSLVVMDDTSIDDSGVETRYRFLETIRQFARDKLLDSGESERVRTQHMLYFDSVALEAEPALRSANSRSWQDRLYTDQDNFRAAIEWALAHDPETALRIAGSLMFFWSERGRMTEGLAWLRQSLAQVDALPAVDGKAARQREALRARGLGAVAHLSVLLGENRTARAAADESIVLYQSLGDNDGRHRPMRARH